MKRTAVLLICLALLAGCGSSSAAAAEATAAAAPTTGCEFSIDATPCADDTGAEETEAPSSYEVHIGEPSDMSGYDTWNAATEYVFVDSDVEHMLERMNNGDTFATFFGFAGCPWCRDAMPIINEVAASFGQKVDYINTRADASWQSNLDLKDYDRLTDAIGDLFPIDENGKEHLDVPFIVFFKDGKVVSSAGYPDYDAHERKINAEEAAEEEADYTAGFESMLK